LKKSWGDNMANKRAYKPKPAYQTKTALERIRKLFKEAASAFKEDKKLSNRYVSLARKIAMKYKVKIPSPLKKRFCKHCYSYLKPSVNCRVRLQKEKVVYYCLKCKKFMRFPYKNKLL
jgi:ribonuclease P protein subunit RPR2